MSRLMAVLILAVAVTGTSIAETYIVKPDGTGHYPTIQAAIDASTDGDIIELTDGTFLGYGNRDIDYQGRAITVRSQGGDPLKCVINCEGSETDPHRGILFQTAEPSTSVLEGITIRRGLAWHGVNGSSGGAVLCRDNASPTFINCRFVNNHAGGIPGGGAGAGVGITDGASPTFEDCAFEECHAYSGGGVACESASVTLSGCSFTGNSAVYGGGAYGRYGADVEITRCLFYDNYGAYYAGGVVSFGAHVAIDGSTFSGNDGWVGSAIFLGDAPTAIVQNTIVAFGVNGPGVKCEGTDPTLTCCDVYGNEGGDWVGCIAGQHGIAGNIALDPLFCDAPNGDFTLHGDSPCAPENNPECGLIGALDVGCPPTTGVDELNPSERAITWGRTKALFR